MTLSDRPAGLNGAAAGVLGRSEQHILIGYVTKTLQTKCSSDFSHRSVCLVKNQPVLDILSWKIGKAWLLSLLLSPDFLGRLEAYIISKTLGSRRSLKCHGRSAPPP